MKGLLETTENTRDLGGYLRKNGKRTQCDQFLRSDKPEHPSEGDFRFLLSRGITTIIDLREEAAVNRLENPFANHPGFSWHHCPIQEGSSIPELISKIAGSGMIYSDCTPKTGRTSNHIQKEKKDGRQSKSCCRDDLQLDQ